MTSGIYRIDLGNGWFYIGSAANLKRREREHRRHLDSRDHHNHRLQRCWEKYKTFEFAILEECTKDQLLSREQTYLDKHFHNPKNVNLAPIAGSSLGVVHSAETRAKMSRAKKNMSAETRAKISNAAKLRPPMSTETRTKMSQAGKRKVFSAEHRAKLSAANRRRKHSVYTRTKMSEAGKRKVFSAKHRANLSKATKLYWDMRKAQAA